MTAEVVPIGEKLISQEADLDRQFARRVVTPSGLDSATAAIGVTQAELRKAHLKYHLMTSELLTPAQMQHYAQLRGYVEEDSGIQHRPNHLMINRRLFCVNLSSNSPHPLNDVGRTRITTT